MRGANEYLLNLDADAGHEIDVTYGLAGDIHVTGNWTGNGADQPGVVRGGYADGLLRWFLDTDGDPGHELEYAYGLAGDRPVAGNWDGVGGDNIGVVRNSPDGLMRWYLDTDGDPLHGIEYGFGLNGDTPIVGDWNGDGRTDVGVVRAAADGLLHWYLNTDNDVWPEDEYAFGLPGDRPVVGDWNNDGRDDIGVVRAEANGLLRWYFNTNRDAAAESTFDYGFHTDFPIVGKWRMAEVRLSGSNLVNQQLNFGVVTPGSTRPQRSVTVTNDGNVALNLGAVQLPLGYQLVGTFPTQLAANQSTTLTVAMQTSTNGNFTGNLTFTTNDGNETTVRIPLNGVVQPPVSTPKFPEIDIPGVTHQQPTPVELGTVVLNGQLSRTFTVTNLGPGTLSISRPTSVPSGFRLDWNVASSLATNGTGSFIVHVDTAVAGTKTGSLSIPNNDQDEGPFVIPLRAIVQPNTPSAPEVEIVGAAHGQVIAYGSVVRGSAAVSNSFTIKNTGTAPLTVTRPPNVTGFTLGWNVPSTIPPGASYPFTVTLSTATAGSFAGDVVIANNDADENNYRFRVTGTVTAPPPATPEIDIPGLTDGVGTVDFGTNFVGSNVRRTFTVRNLGSGTLTISSVHFPAGFTVSGMPPSISPLGSATFTISVNTSVAATRTGTIRINNNDADEGVYDIAVRAQVLAIPTSNYGTVLGFERVTSSLGTIVVKHIRTYSGTGNNERIYADFYASNGALISSDKAIGDHSLSGLHQQVTVTALSNGNFALSWVRKGLGGVTEIRYSVMDTYARAVGSPDRQANIASSLSLHSPTIVLTSAGFDIHWQNSSNGSRWRRSFTFQGVAISGESRI